MKITTFQDVSCTANKDDVSPWTEAPDTEAYILDMMIQAQFGQKYRPERGTGFHVDDVFDNQDQHVKLWQKVNIHGHNVYWFRVYGGGWSDWSWILVENSNIRSELKMALSMAGLREGFRISEDATKYSISWKTAMTAIEEVLSGKFKRKFNEQIMSAKTFKPGDRVMWSPDLPPNDSAPGIGVVDDPNRWYQGHAIPTGMLHVRFGSGTNFSSAGWYAPHQLRKVDDTQVIGKIAEEL